MNSKRIILSTLLIVLNYSSQIFAANYTCTVTSNNANFGNFNPLNYSASTTTATFTVSCPLNSGVLIANESVVITFSQGNAGSFTRYMTSGANKLSYNLYKDNNYTQVLGDGTGSTYNISASGTVYAIYGTPQMSFTVYGKIPSQPNAVKGSYSDNIIITVTYQ